MQSPRSPFSMNADVVISDLAYTGLGDANSATAVVLTIVAESRNDICSASQRLRLLFHRVSGQIYVMTPAKEIQREEERISIANILEWNMVSSGINWRNGISDTLRFAHTKITQKLQGATVHLARIENGPKIVQFATFNYRLAAAKFWCTFKIDDQAAA